MACGILMADPVTVPQTPALVRVPNVEIMHTGTWNLSTGSFTFTTDDLADAVAALSCPAVRRPILKLGHTDPRFDGEPCIGYIDNLATAEGGRTLVGDYAGMPGWLGDILASAYPDRSVEGEYDYRCQMGHIHPFAVHAVALLGVAAPGIGTLESLQDVAALYGVTAKRDHVGTPVMVQVKGSSSVSSPYSRPVAAGVSAEDVMRAFYGSELGSGWDAWIEELQLDPLQLIYVNDADSTRSRVPVTIGEGDGSDAVSFGDPVPVIIRYVDAAAALSRPDVVRCAYRSRPDTLPAAAPPGERSGMELTDEQLAAIRTAYGLPDDADDTALYNAIVTAAQTSDPPESPPPALPEGTVAVDAAQFEELKVAAKAGADARAQQEQERREGLVSAAVRDGRIPPARKDHWLTMLERDPGSVDVLASLSPGLVPVGPELGHSGTANTAEDELYAKLFGGAPAGADT
jgi:hypothetical protein